MLKITRFLPLLAAALLAAIPAGAQSQFERTYSRTGIYATQDIFSIRALPEGGFMATGRFRDIYSLNYDMFLGRFDDNGALQWGKMYGKDNFNSAPAAPSFDDIAFDLERTYDGGYIMAGYTDLGIDNNIYIIRTDATGELLWSQTYTGCTNSMAFSVNETPDGGFLVVGASACDASAKNDNLLVLRLDQKGRTEWARLIGQKGTTHQYRGMVLADGSYLIIGNDAFPVQITRAHLVKLNNAGIVEWNYQYDLDALNTIVSDVVEIPFASAFSYIMIGSTVNPAPTNDHKLFTIRLGPNGRPVDQAVVYGFPEGTSGTLEVHDAMLLSNERIAFAGSAGTGPVTTAIVGSIDLAQEVQWLRAIKGAKDDPSSFTSIAPASDGGFFLTRGKDRFYVARLDAQGRTGCEATDLPLTTARGNMAVINLDTATVSEWTATRTNLATEVHDMPGLTLATICGTALGVDRPSGMERIQGTAIAARRGEMLQLAASGTAAGKASVSIADAAGREIELRVIEMLPRSQGNAAVTVETATLPAGIYLIRVETASGSAEHKVVLY